MIVRKIVLALVAASAILAATGVFVVAAAYAVFALCRDLVGPAGAAAVVCACAALIIALVGLVAGLQASKAAKAYKKANAAGAPSLLDHVIDLVREKPIVSAGTLIAGAAMAVRNPGLLMGVIKTVLNQRRSSKPK